MSSGHNGRSYIFVEIMNDTPEHVKQLQLKIWLSKSPEERLRQMMENNAALLKFWASARKVTKDDNQQVQGGPDSNLPG